ncbi:ThiF family adenylyltransferase [Terriglobus sp. 2YAB30_2]|uniref:HesA/MoeB/ThiF family protein n=1 Tax=Terriglobus sp. 2YAB30_2 TaxID=3233023 RepID=UPI003F9AA329
MNLQRQSFLGAHSDTVLARSRAALIGLGGGGSHIAQQLAHIGLGHFLVIDPDFIEDTNLNRLVGGTQEDVRLGTAKVDIAERVIKSVNPVAEVVKRLASWAEVTAELRDVDVIFSCVDSIGCRSELESFARRFLIPLIDIGMDVHESNGEFSISGQAMLSMPTKPCMRCMGLVTDNGLTKEAAQYGAAGGKPQVVWPNGTLASVAVGFFMKLMTPWETQKTTPLLLEYDGDLQTVMPSNKLAYLPAHCKHFDSAHGLGDPFWTANVLVTVE